MLALPDKRLTFDAKRRRMTLAHLLEDHASTAPPAVRNRAHLDEWAEHVEKLRPGTAEHKKWIEQQLRDGYAVHNHVWIPRDVLELVEWIANNRAPMHIERFANTSPLTNEFIFLLRRGTARGETMLRLRLCVTDPLLAVLAALKRLLARTRNRSAHPR
jgi:hypothetical protein